MSKEFFTSLQCVWDPCVLRNTSAHLGHSTENVAGIFSQPEAWAAPGFVRFVPEGGAGLCSSSFRPCESSEQAGPGSQAPPQCSHIPVSARVLLMWRIRNSSCFTDLVYKLLYSGLKSPDFKFHSHKFVGAHNWLMGLSPAFFQLASPSFLWLEVFGVLQNEENIQENAGEVMFTSLLK